MINFNSNVPIIPSRQQILNATREIQFDNIENPINNSCPISLEAFQNSDIVTQILHCGHNFNTRQLNRWFESNVRCPMCRYDIRDYVRNNRSYENSETNTESETNIDEISETTEPLNTRPQNRTRTTRRVFTPPILGTNINNISSNLSSVAFDEINELFEQNNNTFTDNGNSRLLFDPSNNILLFETIINNNNNNSRHIV
jgi:hypothetical protein